MERPDFDKLTEAEKQMLFTYVKLSLDRVMCRQKMKRKLESEVENAKCK